MAGKSCCGGGGVSTVNVTMPADNEIAVLCDVAADGTSTPFLRRYAVDASGAVTTTDTGLDGITAYTVGGTVTTCAGAPEDESPGPMPSGKQILERCGCDDTNGDGVGDVPYTELWGIDPYGVDGPVLLGTYRDGDLTQPYTPVSPADCVIDAGGGTTPPPTPVTIHSGGANLPASTAASLPTSGLQSVTVTTLTGATDVVTDSGTVTIPAGASLTWSVTRDQDQALTVTSVTTQAGSTALVAWTNV
jgi:hypothetical protein